MTQKYDRGDEMYTSIKEECYNNTNVVVIPASKPTYAKIKLNERKALRVAAYCRVSTGDESQQTSYTTQKNFYTSMIRNREG